MSYRDPIFPGTLRQATQAGASFHTASTAPAMADNNSDAINKTLEQIKHLVARLDQRFQEISSITGVITGLSKRSNLLALNAAIEAARAGTQGRGFAVVADEVRRLSENTATATADISKMLASVQEESKQAVVQVELAERDSALQMATLLAARDAARLEQRFQRIAVALAGIRHFIVGNKSAGLTPRREDIDALMAESLRANPDLLAFSCGCEPNALDGQDEQYANQAPGHDGTGRYVPYWNRGSGLVEVEALANYDIPGENDYYEVPRKTRQDTLMEPYRYPVGGKEVLMTSLMLPLLVQGIFIGVVGADYALSQLQTELGASKPFGCGSVALLSNQATYVTNPEADKLGHAATDLPQEARTAISQGKPYQYVDDKLIARVFQPLNIGGHTPWSMMVRFDLLEVLGQSRKAA
ncbi:MAG: methyl-accepting chemotaxis protein [Formivibrio sp.]|nr:methyl-accepting chemotaxis protein [Formivibrio sp.]